MQTLTSTDQDQIALSMAQVVMQANRRAREAGMAPDYSLLEITHFSDPNGDFWRVSYGPRDAVKQRGGDLIVDVAADGSGVQRVLWGQ